MFVKETKTCHYNIVINTPRLCGEPGFKSRIDQRDEALIRCRQIVDAATLANADSSLPESDHPFRQRRPPSANAPPLDAAETPEAAAADSGDDDALSPKATDPDSDSEDGGAGPLDRSEFLRRALEAILQKTGLPHGDGAAGTAAAAAPRVVVEEVGDGEMVIEFISEIEDDGSDTTADGGAERRRRVADDISRMMEFEDALRAAGLDVRDEGVEFEVGVGVGGKDDSAERDEEGQQQQRKGERAARNGAAKGRQQRPNNAHVGRDEL
jgi:protein OS-9